MKVLIAGSRTFDDPEFMKAQMYYSFKDELITEIVHGGQVSYKKDGTKYGADYWGGEWAKERGIPVKVFKADWDKYGNPAGPIRNAEMAKYLDPAEDAAIVFWNGASKGSKDMITRLIRNKIKTHIIDFETIQPQYDMQVDFNNLRLQACNAYDKLCIKLNTHIKENPELIQEIEDAMDALRMCLASIASSYRPDDPDMIAVYNDRVGMVYFNPEPKTIQSPNTQTESK